MRNKDDKALAVRHFAGLDLGTAGEFTALAVLECPVVTAQDPPANLRPTYELRHLQRFPLGTPYPEIVDSVVGLLQYIPCREPLSSWIRRGLGGQQSSC